MATTRERRIVETPTEARQAEPGPSILVLLLVSLGPRCYHLCGCLDYLLPSLSDESKRLEWPARQEFY